MASNKKGKKYKCPYCDYRDYRPELIDHVEDEHEEMIPKGYTPSRVVYNTINKKDHGTCMVCHRETKWDEDKQRYDSLCGRPKCKQDYIKIVRSRMVKKYGTYNLLTNPEFQKKMLEGRSISGKYKFQDGGSVGYVGSYEKKFLEFMDTFLHIKSYDIISPGPNIPYMYKGKEHVWITDFLYEPYNLVFDIKDGGDNPNTRDMVEYREKQLAKEKAIAEYGDYNYIRLTDNKFEQLISIFMELKEKTDEKPLIRINESFIQEETYIEELGVFEMTFAVFLALFWGAVGVMNIKEYINKKVEENAYHYEVSDRPLKSIPKYGNLRTKDALAYYAYYSLKIRKTEKSTLLYTSNNKSNLNKHIYLYKFNKNKLVLVEEGKFIDICEKNNVKIKSLDESKLSGREEAYNLAVNIIKKEINKYADLKKHVSIGEDDKEYYSNFINGIDDEICVLRCDLWDVVPNARSDEGDKLASEKVWNPSDEIIKIINSKLPKNFKVDHGGDWDDLMILLTHKVSIKESYVKEETRIDKDKLPKFIYHISSENHNGETFEPRKYDNENVKNDMERYVARVCFADRIDGCLYSIFPNGAYDAEFYVHVPGNEVKVYSTTKDDVYDSEITHELWVKEPVEMKCIGKIKVTGVSNNKTKTIDIESDKVPYNKKKYHKCIWKWVEKYDKDESLFEPNK